MAATPDPKGSRAATLATYLGWRAAFALIGVVAFSAFVVQRLIALAERGRWTAAEVRVG